VLTLLTHALPNKKIARMLNVSLDTVKYHLRNVYAKLGVAGRDEAVARLREAQSPRLG
jgi:LuxR family maltose regulon positive regulatory protein